MKLDKFVLTYNGNKYREAKKLSFINVNEGLDTIFSRSQKVGLDHFPR